MKRLWRFREVLMLPIKLLVLGTFLMAISVLVSRVSLPFIGAGATNLITVLTSYLGYYLIAFVPLVIGYNHVYMRNKDNRSIILFTVIYMTYVLTTTIFAPQGLSTQSYGGMLAFSIPISEKVTLVPLNTGLIGVLVCSNITNYIFRNYNRQAFGFFNFIDRDGLLYGAGILAAVLFGFITVLIWPFFVQLIDWLISIIKQDITNPFNLMLYGFVDKLLSLVWLRPIFNHPFLFGEAGGSWDSLKGITYFGDISIWTAQYDLGEVLEGIGRFITMQYVVNLFIVPAMIIAMYFRTTHRAIRRRQVPIIIIVLFSIMLSGNPIAFELVLLAIAPKLFVAYFMIVGASYIIPNLFSVFVGYSFTGLDQRLIYSGNILDLFRIGGDGTMQYDIFNIMIVGILLALILTVITVLYFKKGGNIFKKKAKISIDVHGLIVALGGRVNIQGVDSTMSKVTVQVENRGKVDIEALQQLGATAIVQTRYGFSIVFGSQSVLIKEEIKKQIKASETE